MDHIQTSRHSAPRPRRLSAREALEELGGLAGAKAIAALLTETSGRQVTVRQVRDRFRNTGGAVRKLGAGYFATRRRRELPVADFVESLLDERSPVDAMDICQAVLSAFPNGDERAVMAWLYQDPGNIRVRDDRVSLRSPR